MQSSGMDMILAVGMAMLFSLFFYGVIGSLICAVMLRISAKWVSDKDIDFGNAFLTCLFFILANLGLSMVVMVALLAVMGNSARQEQMSLDPSFFQIFILPLQFAIQSWIIQLRHEISFGKSCLISLVMLVMMIGVILALAVSFGILMIFLGGNLGGGRW